MSPSIHQQPSALLTTTTVSTLLLSLASLIQPALAGPYPKDDLHELGFGYLMDRSCATYCGVDNQYCCSEGQACTTKGNIAGCTDTAYGGGWDLYTTTWTETDTYTSTLSSYYAVTTAAAGSSCTPAEGSGQIACGSICCANWQYCAYDGQCSANGGSGATTTAGGGAGVGGGGGGVAATTAMSTYKTTITSAGEVITTQYSAPYRVTGTSTNTAFLESSTGGSANGTAVTTGGASLSGGAIAGIVIGVILGVILLLAICACCLMRGLWHGLLAIFGLGPKKQRSRSHDRETIIIEEERYARHGGGAAAGAGLAGAAAGAAAAGRRDRHDGWFAARPARSARTGATDSRRMSQSEKRRESTNNAGWWGTGAMGTMGAMLGLKKDQKRKAEAAKRTSRSSRPRARSDVSSSYFSDSYTASSPRSASSGGRTRDTRRSHRTETERISRAHSRRR